MILANLRGHRTSAHPGITDATCPTCSAPVVPKCGHINVWHWAHQAKVDCDPWAELDSAWHLDWQQAVPAERREVVIGPHRADMLTATGIVVEVQHSALSVDDIQERENHYGRMVWIFDAIDAARPREYIENLRLDGSGVIEREPAPWSARLEIRTPTGHSEPTYRTFRWKHARKSIAACRQPVFLDLGEDRILRLGRIHVGPPCGGWGHLLTRQTLVDLINRPRP